MHTLPAGITTLIFDVEGTTTDLSFVHEVLFPDATRHLPGFVREQVDQPLVQAALAQVQATLIDEGQAPSSDSVDTVIETLLHWIATDRKHPALKTLQGLIWEAGYTSGRFQGHVYPDVPQAFQRWHVQGLKLGIYSSGSVLAQQLLFRHSAAGDLTPLLSAYFDTAVGAKGDAASYTAIAAKLSTPPEALAFFSDRPPELAAARAAGWHVVHVVRDERTAPAPDYPAIATFEAIAQI